MAVYVVEIPLKLPSLNDYILACRKNKYAGGKFKKDIDEKISSYLNDLPMFEKKISIHFHWIEKSQRRDPDNIASGCKYILDSMKKCGKIHNDSWKWIDTKKGYTHTFENGENDKVIITIKEVT